MRTLKKGNEIVNERDNLFLDAALLSDYTCTNTTTRAGRLAGGYLARVRQGSRFFRVEATPANAGVRRPRGNRVRETIPYCRVAVFVGKDTRMIHHDDEMDPSPGHLWCWKGGARMPEEANQYAFRKDPMERDRLNLQHSIHRRGLGGNFHAPIGKTSDKLDMLDIAGGTGIWGREMARQFPHAQVETFDKDTFLLEQAAQRMKADMPGNCHHYPRSVNALERWPYPDASFDYVHGRYLTSFTPYAQWPHIASEALRVLRPGGWVEFVEGAVTRCDAPAFQELMGAAERMMRQIVGEGEAYEVVPESLQAAGAINVQLQPYLLGAGTTKALQPDIAEDLYRVFQAMGPRIMAAGVIEDWRYLDCMAHLKEDMLAAGIVLPVYVVIGQKPLTWA